MTRNTRAGGVLLTVQKHFLVLVVCGLWLAACGTDTPEIIVPAAPTGSEAVATGGPEQQPTATTTVGSTSVPDVDSEPEETTTTTGETPGGTPDTTSTTVETVEPDVTTTTITVVEDDTEDVEFPPGVVVSDGAPAWASLNPGTSEDLVGWSHTEPVFGYEGGISVRLEGWSVTPTTTSDGVPLIELGLTVTLVGDYTLGDGQRPLSLLAAQTRESGQEPAVAVAFFPDHPEQIISHSGPIDNSVWAPVVPGEERPVSFRWVVPGETARVDVTISNDITYSVTTQQGQWGTVTAPARPVTDIENLFGSCFTVEECATFGMEGYERIVLRFYWEPPTGGIEFQLEVQPAPTTREGMTNTDLTAWYEGGETWNPHRDVWEDYVADQGWVRIGLRMPLAAETLYLRWDTPEGVPLTWKTTATVRHSLFANPDWVWNTEVPEWGEQEAILAADRICWAHWTDTHPYVLFLKPVDTDGTITWVMEVDVGDGTTAEITDDMIAWVVEELC